jgi:GalNAc-alpha-(1->4)-GalNAc-alpha-(1->3)-diNAcBac-PP-undecaprenol alpha-1,4-N-acetyl-D-galactosaminyltransferase
MKILFVSGNLCDGGAQRVIAVVASALAEKGHDVHLLLYSRNEKEYPISKLVQIESLANNYNEYTKLSSLERVFRIRKIIGLLKPDVGIGFLEGGYGLYISSMGLGLPKIASARIKPDVIMKAKGLRGKINRLWFSHADAVVLQNEEQAEQAPTKLWRNCTVIPNPVSPKALQAKPCIHDAVKRIVMVGRLADQKNYEMIIDAMKIVHREYPDVVVDIFGKGNKEKALKEKIKVAGLSNTINLRGWTQNAIEEYADSDLYILTSDYEGMPNSLLEAMAVGIPCISTSCETGPKEMIDNGINGFLVPVKDVNALATCITDIIKMPKHIRESIGWNAKNTVKAKYTEQIIANKWEELLFSVVRR